MKEKLRIFAAEFRRAALRLLDSRGKHVAEIEQELEIALCLLYKWRARIGSGRQ